MPVKQPRQGLVRVEGCSTPSTLFLVSITFTSSSTASLHHPWFWYMVASIPQLSDLLTSSCSEPPSGAWDIVDADGIFMFVTWSEPRSSTGRRATGLNRLQQYCSTTKTINDRLIATLFPVTDVPPTGSKHYCQICENTFAICGERDEPSAGNNDDKGH